MKTRVVALANQKGGVGKTTTAINLAAGLAELKRKVLLIDMDPQGNATSGVGVDKKQGQSIYRALLGEAPLKDVIVQTKFCNLDLVPSELDLAGAEVHVARADRYLHRFSDAMTPLRDSNVYDYIIVDCPPSLGILTMNALAAAHFVVIPMQCEYYALEGLTVINSFVEKIRTSGANPVLEIEGIIFTMYDGRTKLSGQVVEEVRAHFGNKVYQTLIPRNVRLSEAPSYGMPALEFDKSSSGAIAYRQFACEFLKRIEEQVPAQAPKPTPPPGTAQ